MKKILLSGGTSIIGSAIVRQYIANGDDVTCVCRANSPRAIKNIPKNNKHVHVIDCHLGDYDNLIIESNYDVFIHCAWANTNVNAKDDVISQNKNIEYTIQAVQLAKRAGCKVFLFAGSQAEYGIHDKPLTPETPVNPQSGYGIAKYAAERFANLLCSQLGIRFNSLRILSVYGQNDGYDVLMCYLIRELMAGRSPELTKCEQIWDYLYCDDCARAFVSVAEKGIDGKVYTVGSGKPRKLREYVEVVQHIVAPDIPVKFGAKEYYKHQPMYLVADISEISKDTGWKPIVSFEEGIKNIVNI